MLKALARLFRCGSAAPQVPAKEPAPQADADALLAAPIAATREGRRDDAIALLEAVTREHPEFADAHLLLGTVLHQQKRHEDARDSYLLASCFRPDWWLPHFHQGLLALDERRYGDAVASLVKALEFGAVEGRVHNALGAAHLHGGNVTGAVEQFRKAVELQPDLVSAHSNLGYVLLRDLEQFEEGARHIQRALELAPDDSSALCNWIMVLSRRGDTEGALDLADKLLARDPDLSEARLNRALMLLTQGNFAQAWPDYEARKRLPGNTCTSDAPWPEWDGSSLAGRGVFVYGEQGLGDEMMFASCIPDLAAAAGACTLECHPRLVKIFSRSFEDVRVIAKHAWRGERSVMARQPHLKVAIGSLPLFFRRSRAAFPTHAGYLHADEKRVTYWKARLAALPGRKKVGISWRGGVASSTRSLRSIPLRQWLPILALPDIDFVSLQYADPEGELQALESGVIRVHQWQDAIDDYDETAALVCALDLVVSVQTALVHLAGALGRETWALISAAPEWRYGSRGDSMPWYPAVKLIRQSGAGEWEAVLERIAADLRAWMAADQ